MKEKYHSWLNHHPVASGYCWTFVFLFICAELDVDGILLNIVWAYLSVIWVIVGVRSRLSSKKRKIDLPNNSYMSQVSFQIPLYINDVFFALLALGYFLGGSNIFLGVCLLVIVIASFIPFDYQDDEYQQMLQQTENEDDLHSLPVKTKNSEMGNSTVVKTVSDSKPTKPVKKDVLEPEKESSVVTDRKSETFAPTSNMALSTTSLHNDKEKGKPRDKEKEKLHTDILYVDVAGTKYHDLKKAVNYARHNDLFFDTYDDLSAPKIREDLYTDDDPLYETDMSDVIDHITFQPEPTNKYDHRAIRVIIHIEDQAFMIGYVPKESLDDVWNVLKKVEHGLMTVNIHGYMDGGKYKAVDLDDHIYTGEKPRTFSLTIETTETPFSYTKKGVNVAKSIKEEKPLVIHKMRKPLTSFVAIDIETTGLNAPNDKVIQLSSIKYVNDELVDSFDSYINPGENKLPLSDFITKLTGIKSSDVENAPSLSEIKDKFIEFVGPLPWVGHNIFRFDIPFLYSSDIGISEFYAEDTYNLAKKKLDRAILGNLKLPTIKKYYGIQGASHNALADCKTTATVYRRLRDTTLPDMLNEDNKLPSLKDIHFLVIGSFPELYHSAIVQQIKLRSGVVDFRWNKQTTYLVNGITDKTYKSIQQSKDHNVKFLNFTEFVNLLEDKDRRFTHSGN